MCMHICQSHINKPFIRHWSGPIFNSQWLKGHQWLVQPSEKVWLAKANNMVVCKSQAAGDEVRLKSKLFFFLCFSVFSFPLGKKLRRKFLTWVFCPLWTNNYWAYIITKCISTTSARFLVSWSSMKSRVTAEYLSTGMLSDVARTENLDSQDSRASENRSGDTGRLSPVETSCF